jgi:hypothetical protein
MRVDVSLTKENYLDSNASVQAYMALTRIGMDPQTPIVINWTFSICEMSHNGDNGLPFRQLEVCSTVFLMSHHSASILIINCSPSLDCVTHSYLIITNDAQKNHWQSFSLAVPSMLQGVTVR